MTSSRFPATKRRKYLEENAAAVDFSVQSHMIDALRDIFPPDAVKSERYAAEFKPLVNA